MNFDKFKIIFKSENAYKQASEYSEIELHYYKCIKSLCRFELEILYECYGYAPARLWGGAVGAALEVLYHLKLTNSCGEPIKDAKIQETIRNILRDRRIIL